MSRTVVVFESMFGNTKAVAEAVAEGASAHSTVALFEVSAAPDTLGADVDLLLVGGPTHGFTMSREDSRRGAAKRPDDGVVSTGIGIREWIGGLEAAAGVAAAAFDTRYAKPRFITGSAARAAERRLRRMGLAIHAPAESFFVVGTEGPLAKGELLRARRWGEGMAERLG